MEEIWKPLVGFETTHEVSNTGRLRRYSGFELKAHEQKGKRSNILSRYYFKVRNEQTKTNHTFYVHRAVAETFLENPHNKPEVNHIDGNPKNNHLSNLEWVTKTENINHAFDTGLIATSKTVYVEGLGEFRSITRASEAMNGSHSALSRCLNNPNRNTFKGYRVRFA
ncbi:HNH endonuclease [Bacillus cereus group sp. TH153LC]|uniref:HNH endonuclease n=1 Tax=Bacillus cereus group sp. TH153LC TaxID=3018059 RepID=UPI0022E09F14|nr:HNH endonuclease [Bacillus cereus group sp. TH153LC]MDA1658813.1 HNH endonuclease [Bacillus cereus group sp. TH153LC]